MRQLSTIARVVLVLLPGVVVAGTTARAPLSPGVGQEQPPEGRGAAPGRGAPGQGRGPNFPQQQRKLADAAVLAKGKVCTRATARRATASTCAAASRAVRICCGRRRSSPTRPVS
jgi:hypothetical protein